MNELFGVNNTWLEYVLVLLLYGLMFLFIRYPKPRLELNYKANFAFLSILWAALMFVCNYLLYKIGLMAFLPWLNNLLHSFIWVGVCLTWLYYCTHERPMWEQFILFAFVSFIIKMAENLVLGSWGMESYLGIKNPYAYMLAMSLADGFYPVLSQWLLKTLGKKSTFGIYSPQLA